MSTDPSFDFGNIELRCDSSCMIMSMAHHTCIMESPDSIDSPDSLNDIDQEEIEISVKESQGAGECKVSAHNMNNDVCKSYDQYDHIKAPANCFLLYRSHVLKDITAKYPGHSSRSITSIVAENWKNEPETVKDHFKGMAAKEKAQFKRRFPEYRRIIKPKVRKRSDSFRAIHSGLGSQRVFSPGSTPNESSGSLNCDSTGRKRSYSMPVMPELIMNDFQKRSSLTFNNILGLGTNSKLGPLLPMEKLNSCKKSYLAEAFGGLI